MLKFFTAGTALLFVIALIFATAALGRWLNPWLVNRFTASRLRIPRPSKPSGGNLVSQVDPRRRLHVMELAGHQFAILTGGPNDVMITLSSNSHREHEL
jgi:hypothetical protein